MFLITATKERFFLKKFKKQLDLKRDEPVWAMVDRFCKVMGNTDDIL